MSVGMIGRETRTGVFARIVFKLHRTSAGGGEDHRINKRLGRIVIHKILKLSMMKSTERSEQH